MKALLLQSTLDEKLQQALVCLSALIAAIIVATVPTLKCSSDGKLRLKVVNTKYHIEKDP